MIQTEFKRNSFCFTTPPDVYRSELLILFRIVINMALEWRCSQWKCYSVFNPLLDIIVSFEKKLKILFLSQSVFQTNIENVKNRSFFLYTSTRITATHGLVKYLNVELLFLVSYILYGCFVYIYIYIYLFRRLRIPSKIIIWPIYPKMCTRTRRR